MEGEDAKEGRAMNPQGFKEEIPAFEQHSL